MDTASRYQPCNTILHRCVWKGNVDAQPNPIGASAY